jgi:ribosomal protein S18 acetylase RimI-like enzyme
MAGAMNQPEHDPRASVTTALTIRPCRPDEVPAVLDVWRLAEAIPSITDTPEDLARLLRHDPDALLVALLDDRIVGTAIATWDGWRGGIWRLAVLPEARRRGVARALLSDAEARLRAKGVRRMSILIESTDPRALAFWEARADMGYTRDQGARRYTKNLDSRVSA